MAADGHAKIRGGKVRDLSTGMILSQPDLFGRRNVTGWKVGDLSVIPAEKPDVEAIIRRYHYSGTVVWSSNVHLVVMNGSAIVGAMQLGPAMNPQSGGRVVRGSTADSWLELNRMAFVPTRPEYTGTRALSAMFRYLRHARPLVEWVQSFADERCLKFGGIYQAASLLYCGEHVATFYELDGEWFHKSAWGRKPVDKRGWGCGPRLEYFNANRDRAVPMVFRQFRHIKCLTRRAMKGLLLPVLPYPKPGRHDESSHSATV